MFTLLEPVNDIQYVQAELPVQNHTSFAPQHLLNRRPIATINSNASRYFLILVFLVLRLRNFADDADARFAGFEVALFRNSAATANGYYNLIEKFALSKVSLYAACRTTFDSDGEVHV